MNELNELRRKGASALLIVCWLCVAVTLSGALFSPAGVLPAVLAGAVTAAPTLLVLRGENTLQTRLTFGFALPLYPAILLWQWAGHDWMLDLHMMFFAVLAMLAILADWRPVILAAAVIAAHHLFTNLLLPSLVFPEGAHFGRVLLHAVIVFCETVVLVVIARSFEQLVIDQAAAQGARERMEESSKQERAAAAAQQKMVIDRIGTGLRGLAGGDLALRLNEQFPSSYEELRGYFNATATDLDRIVRDVSGAADQIETGTREIRSATDDLAQRTEQQASTLEDIANTLRQLNVTVQANASSAIELQGNVSRARSDALAGSSVVENAVGAMGEIERSADQISQIIALIDGIAFQTNLLALNAGVEAARAGEAGKGFAVVATEVRALAQRSADAANDIKALISTSSEQVSKGVRLVGQSGESLMTIVSGIADIDRSIERIASVSQEQAVEIGRISERIARLDSATQQNAAMAEQGTAAARTLSSEAVTLSQLVAHFQVTGKSSGPSALSAAGFSMAAA